MSNGRREVTGEDRWIRKMIWDVAALFGTALLDVLAIGVALGRMPH